MDRTITGYHRDDEGEWVAELSCGHNQHVRHRPPFQVRPWVTDEDGRSARLGTVLGCPRCDRAELPEGLRYVRASQVWDEHTMPSGLRRAHRIATGSWGRLVVSEGRLRFSAATIPAFEASVDTTRTQAIPPDVEHHIEPLGAVRFLIEFYAIDRHEHRPGTDHGRGTIDEGGDPACWAHLVSDDSGGIEDQ
jgi:tellurite methyltransferase